AGEAAHGRAHRGAAQRRQDGPRRDERTDARNRERADAGEPAERATDDAAGAGARRGSFRRLRVLLVTQVTRAACVREEDGDVVVREPYRLQLTHDAVGLAL